MATLIADAVRADPGLELAARLTTRTLGLPTQDIPSVDHLAAVASLEPVVVIDFTARQATAVLLDQAMTVGCSLVIGTSGLGDAERDLLAEVGRSRAVVVAANFSLVLLAVARFIRDLSAQVGPTWDAGIMDVHFAGKRDRPSGTARFLAEQWHGARGNHELTPDVAAFRMGDAVSEHRVLAAGSGEHVEVLHRVADRKAFLPGVLCSVRFAAHAQPGIYSLEDVACDAATARK